MWIRSLLILMITMSRVSGANNLFRVEGGYVVGVDVSSERSDQKKLEYQRESQSQDLFQK